MTTKQTIIEAIKEMDISLLEVVLEDDRSYMDVPKDIFIAKLKDEFVKLKGEGFHKFHRVVEGRCGTCETSCRGYSFITMDCQYMDMLFEEKDGQITDLYTCSDFRHDEDFLKKHKIDFSFDKEDQIGFEPSPEVLMSMEAVSKAVKEFESYRNNITDLKVISEYYEKYKYIGSKFDFFGWVEFKYMKDFIELYQLENFNTSEKIFDFVILSFLADIRQED